MDKLKKIEKIFKSYSFDRIYAFKEYGQGKINKTHLMEAAFKGQRKKFIAQIINPKFRIKTLARNFEICHAHLEKKAKKNQALLTPVKNQKGEIFVKHQNDFWRIFEFIQGGRQIDQIKTARQAGQVGKAFARF
ncbi:MAG: hypothetical protein GF347_03780, partial [Candidatus Moranbacteria bacterium]|nr:hypothetical protein [Candidatus Moranbacteria bacterium]